MQQHAYNLSPLHSVHLASPVHSLCRTLHATFGTHHQGHTSATVSAFAWYFCPLGYDAHFAASSPSPQPLSNRCCVIFSNASPTVNSLCSFISFCHSSAHAQRCVFFVSTFATNVFDELLSKGHSPLCHPCEMGFLALPDRHHDTLHHHSVTVTLHVVPNAAAQAAWRVTSTQVHQHFGRSMRKKHRTHLVLPVVQTLSTMLNIRFVRHK